MNDLANSVIMPREDFYELSEAAWHQTYTPAERIASVAQTTMVLAALSGATVAGCWGWAKAMDWLEEKKFQREALTRNAMHSQ